MKKTTKLRTSRTEHVGTSYFTVSKEIGGLSKLLAECLHYASVNSQVLEYELDYPRTFKNHYTLIKKAGLESDLRILMLHAAQHPVAAVDLAVTEHKKDPEQSQIALRSTKKGSIEFAASLTRLLLRLDENESAVQLNWREIGSDKGAHRGGSILVTGMMAVSLTSREVVNLFELDTFKDNINQLEEMQGKKPFNIEEGKITIGDEPLGSSDIHIAKRRFTASIAASKEIYDMLEGYIKVLHKRATPEPLSKMEALTLSDLESLSSVFNTYQIPNHFKHIAYRGTSRMREFDVFMNHEQVGSQDTGNITFQSGDKGDLKLCLALLKLIGHLKKEDFFCVVNATTSKPMPNKAAWSVSRVTPEGITHFSAPDIQRHLKEKLKLAIEKREVSIKDGSLFKLGSL